MDIPDKIYSLRLSDVKSTMEKFTVLLTWEKWEKWPNLQRLICRHRGRDRREGTLRK